MTSQSLGPSSRGATWFAALTGLEPANSAESGIPTVWCADGQCFGRTARYISVVPDPANRFARVRHGEVGLIEGWELARRVAEAVAMDRHERDKRAIIAIVDVASQAYGRTEEAYGIHQALAGAAGAYATARLAGHPIVGLLVGRAMSGAFLAHGYQANRLVAIDDPGVLVHAMGRESAARITLRSVAELEALAARVPPMAYDVQSFASLGLLWKTLAIRNADDPTAEDVGAVRQCLGSAIQDILGDPNRDLATRFGGTNREASRRVRERLKAQWNSPDR